MTLGKVRLSSMEIENQGRNELQEALLNYALKHDISFTLIKSHPYDPSISFKKIRRMYINTNWHNPNEIPFIIGHEIGHIMIGEQGIMYFDSFAGQCAEEKPADLYSLNWIYNYSKRKGDYFEEPGIFMQSYGIPWTMAHATKVLFEHDHDLIY